uniref:Uncharacterized protein n=1 Tax=Arundo donax TaxID=35708 RepID=A0A0A9H302_ARUDO
MKRTRRRKMRWRLRGRSRRR